MEAEVTIMFYLFIYLMVSYVMVGAILFTVKAVLELFPHSPQYPHRVRRQRSVFRALVIIGLLLPLTPYAMVAAQTLVYGPVFRPLLKEALADGIGDADAPILILRVLKITPSSADVYFVQPCLGATGMSQAAGEVIVFRKTPAGWQYKDEHGDVDWDCIWSGCGSAHGNTFPPYWEGL